MTDIVERLRACPGVVCNCAEAADEIERLRSLADSMGKDNTRYLHEIERLRAAHQEPKPDLRTLLPELAVIRQVVKEQKPKPD
jgi:hypothetical protein